MKNVNTLVPAAAGFSDSQLTTRLMEEGCQVVVIDNLTTGKAENLDHIAGRIPFVLGDVNDRSLTPLL